MIRLALILATLAGAPALADPAQITILGEVHDNPDAHLGQAAALSALRPTAVVLEMLTPEEAAQVRADPARLPAIWAATNWPDFALYAPVFAAAGDAVIIGAAAPRDRIMAVHGDGPAAHFGPEAARFGLDADLPPAQQAAREAMQFDAHCKAMPIEMMAGMVAVQRFRDALMAQAALRALAEHGAPVAVIAGNGHARTDWGIPAAIARAAPDVTTHATAFAEVDDGTPYDAVTIVPPAPRDDPCAALTKN